jgi:hypothetical protein
MGGSGCGGFGVFGRKRDGDGGRRVYGATGKWGEEEKKVT